MIIPAKAIDNDRCCTVDHNGGDMYSQQVIPRIEIPLVIMVVFIVVIVTIVLNNIVLVLYFEEFH